MRGEAKPFEITFTRLDREIRVVGTYRPGYEGRYGRRGDDWADPELQITSATLADGQETALTDEEQLQIEDDAREDVFRRYQEALIDDYEDRKRYGQDEP